MNFLFSKPHMSSVPYGINYDSDDPDDDYEDDDDTDPLNEWVAHFLIVNNISSRNCWIVEFR